MDRRFCLQGGICELEPMEEAVASSSQFLFEVIGDSEVDSVPMALLPFDDDDDSESCSGDTPYHSVNDDDDDDGEESDGRTRLKTSIAKYYDDGEEEEEEEEEEVLMKVQEVDKTESDRLFWERCLANGYP